MCRGEEPTDLISRSRAWPTALWYAQIYLCTCGDRLGAVDLASDGAIGSRPVLPLQCLALDATKRLVPIRPSVWQSRGSDAPPLTLCNRSPKV
jgi:hypothetical protein